MTFPKYVVLTGVLTASMLLAACGKEEEPPPPPPPPVNTGPDWTLDDITLDPRVQFPAAYLPDTEDQAQAIADLAAAILNGDSGSVRSSLATGHSAAVDILVTEGKWDSSTQEGRLIRIVNVLSEEGQLLVALGWEGDGIAFPLAFSTVDADSPISFTPYPINGRTEQRAAALDGIPFDPPAFLEEGLGSQPVTAPGSVTPPPPDRDSSNNPGGRRPGGSPGFGG